MDKAKIFLETLNDITEKISGTFSTPQNDKIKPDKAYALIKACGLLRHLLIDGLNLVNQVNRDYKIPIKFRAVNVDAYFPNTYDEFWFTLTPNVSHTPTKSYKLSEFLKLIPLGVGEHYYSVKEIITLCSHVLGGVHSRDPKDEKETAFVKLTKNTDNGIYMSIYSISQVCLTGLCPLAEKVREHTPTSGF